MTNDHVMTIYFLFMFILAFMLKLFNPFLKSNNHGFTSLAESTDTTESTEINAGAMFESFLLCPLPPVCLLLLLFL